MVSLTKGELEIMDIVWERGRATVQEVCDSLDRPLAYTTVMTVLKTLETRRKVVRKVKEGRAHVYEPLVSRDEIGHSMIGQLKRHFAPRSIKSLILNLISEEPISKADLDEIKAALSRLETRE